MPLTLFCTGEEVADAQALDDPALSIETEAAAARLSAFDVVIKSPGISAYRPELLAAAASGTRFIGGTALWFAEHPHACTVCVTGTKGKSTTSALLAHLLRASGHLTALAGNIGLPLLELLNSEAEFWVIELSSYQTGDIAASGVRPEIAVVLNVFPEHLDWHGSHARYVQDKLRLLVEAKPRIAVLNTADASLATLSLPDSDVRWFGRNDGWHLRDEVLYRGVIRVMDATAMPLPGRHNLGNLCAALTAVEALGLDALALAPYAATFVPLPHRLQVVGTRDGITYVNDSISTTPHASLAALDVYRHQRVVLLVGGHDRGVDWNAFAEAMRTHPPAAILTMGQNGPRIHAQLAAVAKTGQLQLETAASLADAVARARALLNDRGGVILLSPGAPSFGAYHDYTERGRDFAALAGFDPDATGVIQGLGII